MPLTAWLFIFKIKCVIMPSILITFSILSIFYNPEITKQTPLLANVA